MEVGSSVFEFLRDSRGSLVASLLLHAGIAALAVVLSLNLRTPMTSLQPLPIDAIVVDSRVLQAAQRAKAERVAEEQARERAAAAAAQAAGEADALAAANSAPPNPDAKARA